MTPQKSLWENQGWCTTCRNQSVLRKGFPAAPVLQCLRAETGSSEFPNHGRLQADYLVVEQRVYLQVLPTLAALTLDPPRSPSARESTGIYFSASHVGKQRPRQTNGTSKVTQRGGSTGSETTPALPKLQTFPSDCPTGVPACAIFDQLLLPGQRVLIALVGPVSSAGSQAGQKPALKDLNSLPFG